jgi:hypothetical protein
MPVAADRPPYNSSAGPEYLARLARRHVYSIIGSLQGNAVAMRQAEAAGERRFGAMTRRRDAQAARVTGAAGGYGRVVKR